MGNEKGGTAPAAGSASARGLPSALRYIPATLAAALLIAALADPAAAARIGASWFYGIFHRAKGDPGVSGEVLLVSADPGGAGLEASAVADLARAIHSLSPSVLVLGPMGFSSREASDTASNAARPGELPPGHMVIAHGFRRFLPWAESEPAGPYPPILSRSLYPFLDGSDPGLKLSKGEGLDLSDTAIGRPAMAAGLSGPSTGFAGPYGEGRLFSIRAFARLERGVTAALGVEAARRALGVPAGKVGYVEGVGILFDAGHVLPIDAGGGIFLRFHGPHGLRRIPASRLLEGSVPASEIEGRIVFVDPAGEAAARVPTVAGPRTSTEIQATAAANLMAGDLLSSPAWGDTLALIAGLVFAGMVALAMLLEFGVFTSLALAAGLAALYPAAAFAAFAKSSLWLPPGLPPLMAAGAYLSLLAARRTARPRSHSFAPSPGQDPALMSRHSQGRIQASGPAVPPSASSQGAGPRIGMAQPSAAAGSFAPPQPRLRPPQERRGGGEAPVTEPRFGGARHSDPRIPPFVPDEVMDLMPARPAASPSKPANGPVPNAGDSSQGGDIERDAKGGLVRVGKYRIIRKMGFGSAGDVFEGFDTHMGRKVAIKTITKNAASNFDRAAERFVLEAKAAGSLNHPCINIIYDFGTIRDVSYMVLEYLDGTTLSQWMRGHPVPPRPEEALPWMRQIGSALDYAHENKIIHRDLKPSNLMVVNGGATIKLLDFGIAKMEDVGLTQTGMTVGTPSYMSPEQLNGIKVGPASDQYALAVLLYQLYTYKLPYQGTKIPEICNRILKNDLIPITEVNASLGKPLWEALRKAMAKAPEERYPDCMSLCRAVESAIPAA